MLRVWIGGWRHVEQTDPTKAHTGKTQTNDQIVKIPQHYPIFNPMMQILKIQLIIRSAVMRALIFQSVQVHQKTNIVLYTIKVINATIRHIRLKYFI